MLVVSCGHTLRGKSEGSGSTAVRPCLIILNFSPFILFFYSQKGSNYSPKTLIIPPKPLNIPSKP